MISSYSTVWLLDMLVVACILALIACLVATFIIMALIFMILYGFIAGDY